jgi:hypothetical protein
MYNSDKPARTTFIVINTVTFRWAYLQLVFEQRRLVSHLLQLLFGILVSNLRFIQGVSLCVQALV